MTIAETALALGISRQRVTIEIHGGKQGLYFEDHGDKGAGFVQYNEPILQGTIERVPQDRAGWQAVRYRGKWYPLRGGIRTPHFIRVNSTTIARGGLSQ